MHSFHLRNLCTYNLVHGNDPQRCCPGLYAKPDSVWISFMTLVSWRCFVALISLSRVCVLVDIKLICPITYLALSWIPSKNRERPKQIILEKNRMEQLSSSESPMFLSLIFFTICLILRTLAPLHKQFSCCSSNMRRNSHQSLSVCFIKAYGEYSLPNLFGKQKCDKLVLVPP